MKQKRGQLNDPSLTDPSLIRQADILQHISDAVIVTNLEFVVVFWNKAAEEMYGWTTEEVLGQPVANFLQTTYPVVEQNSLSAQAVLATTGEWQGQVLQRHKNGRRLSISSSVSLIKDEADSLIGSVAINRDMTDQVQIEAALHESELKLRFVFDVLPIGISVLNEEREILFENAALSKILRLDRLTLLEGGYKNRHYLQADENPMLPEQFATTRALSTGKPVYDVETGIVLDDGDVIWTEVSAIPVEIGDWALVVVTNDVTAQKLQKEEIRRLNQELEQRVQRRTDQLRRANKELQAFAYSVSHDLRAPLRAISGYARFLEEDYAALLGADGQEMLGIVQSETKRMGQLIDDLLLFSRIGRATVDKKQVVMGKLVEEILSQLLLNYDVERIVIKQHEIPNIMADRKLIQRVWHNLLENALKFTVREETAVIEISAQKTEQEIIYAVRDNGVGFDMRYAEKLFSVFHRLHNMRDFPGTGVGLAIVQRIVGRHQGRVWAEADPDQGATFFFSLPK